MECGHKHGDANPQCPLCAFLSAYNQSEVAQHVRGVKREGLLLMRSLLTAAINATEEQFCGAHRTAAGPKAPPQDPVKP